MKWAIAIMCALLTGCATVEKEHYVEQGTKERPISCARIYSKEAKGINGKVMKSQEQVGVILNYMKGKLYLGDSLTGYECKKHISATVWNCNTPMGEAVVILGENNSATYRVVSVFELINPKWTYALCPE
ncbi:hypothetical protein VSS37_03550 [Candidatus Thiothrix sp. Deng01]|uniref:Lipoprotein n=1 Tax=Candidatus Thiothrix phosphatis TaxID=3112415 RepID=A0ABU6CTX2_9GAMM|nr:hypothetical protein [Candidatus Thiothrix sp. Deng01]MEB4590046.1 hypothetical protein [Candidatus Thiothrix sp. Deng01]